MTQMLRRLAFFLLDGGEDLHRTTELLDRRDGGFRSAVNLDRELGLQFAAAEQPHAVPGAAQHARFDQLFGVDGVLRVDLLGIDRLLKAVEIDFDEFEPEHVVKPALRQPPMQRHLAAFKTLDAHARARGLALASAPGRLALARTYATADAHPLFARAGIVGDIAELHRSLPSSLERDLARKPPTTLRGRGPSGRDHAPTSLPLADDADEMLNLGDHAANFRGILQFGDAADLVEFEADQGRALRVVAADRTAGLLDLDRLCGLGHGLELRNARNARVLLFAYRLGVAAEAARLQGRDLEVAACRDRAWRILVLERVEGGANHVVGVRGADRLGDHILDAQCLEYRAHRTTRDDTGTRGRRAQIDPSRAVAAGNVVMQRAALAQRHA